MYRFKVRYGDVAYVAIVKNKQTGLGNGTAFIKMRTTEAVNKLFDELDLGVKLSKLDEIAKMKLEGKKISDLDIPKTEHGTIDGLEIKGRKLEIAKAITKERANTKKEEKMKRKEDKRNLYLSKEGRMYFVLIIATYY